jgi:hypothetical protein
MRRYLNVGLELGEADLDPWRYNALGPFEAALRHEALDLAWIGGILNAVFTPAYHAGEDTTLLGVVGSRTEAWFDGDLVLLRDRLSNQSSAGLGPLEVKSSPCTEVTIPFSACRSRSGQAPPCVNPKARRLVEYSSCQPSAAMRVPYIWRSSRPTFTSESASPGGNCTKVGGSAGSISALNMLS